MFSLSRCNGICLDSKILYVNTKHTYTVAFATYSRVEIFDLFLGLKT